MSSTQNSNDDLHGNVPDSASTVLLLVDVINDLQFPNNEYLLKQAPDLADRIASLKARCACGRIPSIYVNDNRDKWRSDFPHVLKQSLKPHSPGRAFVRKLIPRRDDYIILKPKHSAFYATPLETVLSYVKAKRIILVGLTTNACVLGTAMELYVRDFNIFVPSDCVAALTKKEHEYALALMRNSFGVNCTRSSDLKLQPRSRRSLSKSGASSTH